MKRTQMTRITLGVLRRQRIGFLPQSPCTSPVADLHPLELGPASTPGYMGSIRIDGSLRPGHDVFNQF